MEYDDMRNEYSKIAFYYYKMGLTQDEIAKKMSTSRPRINRIIKKCLEMGIVRIEIEAIEKQNVEFEVQLENLLGLKEIIIAGDKSTTDTSVIGAAASSYLERVINDGDIIGFSRGRALSSFVSSLKPVQASSLTVTQLVGGLNAGEVSINSDGIVRRASEVLGAAPCYMYAPIILESPELRESLIKESFYTNIYKTMKECTIAIVGIGNMSRNSAFDQRKYIFESELEALHSGNAVGEVCTRYFDVNGNILKTSLDDRVLAIGLNDYQRIPLRIGIAYGDEKLSAILGAIRSQLINVLITDLQTANSLKKMVQN
jgi:DNA-binding transcriptional regulator LsrR (DeoR family)